MRTTLASDTVPLAYLVELQLTGGTVYYALHDADITFDGQTYSANNGTLTPIEQNIEGQMPRVMLTIQTLDDTLRDLMKGADQRGISVVLRLVMTDDLDNSASVIETPHTLDAYGWNVGSVKMDLLASQILHGIQVPGRRTQTWFCPFEYKGSECGYVGSLVSCDFTYDGPNGCTHHFGKDVAKRFGGFIGRPRANIAIY
jgi:phage-related protein